MKGTAMPGIFASDIAGVGTGSAKAGKCSVRIKEYLIPARSERIGPVTMIRQKETPKTLENKGFGVIFGVPEVIRTPDLPLRRRSLYPAELRKRI